MKMLPKATLLLWYGKRLLCILFSWFSV